jgi:hypothetical protein
MIGYVKKTSKLYLGKGMVIVFQPNLTQIRNSVAIIDTRTQDCRPSRLHSGSSWTIAHVTKVPTNEIRTERVFTNN